MIISSTASKIRCGLLLVLTALLASRASSMDWQTGMVDISGTGEFCSLRIDTYGNAHVSYFDESQNILKYGFWDHRLGRWFTTTLDKSAGMGSLALDSRQHPHISHLSPDGKLKYTYWDGSQWHSTSIEIQAKIIGFYTSITVDPQDHPRISFYEYNGLDDYRLRLRIVAWNGKYWEVSTVDGEEGSGKFSSITTDSAGNLHIAYANVKYENESLRYASYDGRMWKIEVLEGAQKPAPIWSPSLVLDRQDNPHIVYVDAFTQQVKYATRRDGKWVIEVVDVLAKVGFPDRYGIAVDADGTPYVSYDDAGRSILKIAYRKGDKWVAGILERNFSGLTSSLQLDHGSVLVIYGSQVGGPLKFARAPLEESGGAVPEDLASLAK